jgi:hypothetical protein
MTLRPLLLGLAVCLPGAAARAGGFDDPAAYCRAVGTADRVDDRYTGPAVPDWMAAALRRAAGAPAADAPLDAFRRAAWRCDRGRVMACSYGANIPCDAKADVSRKPGPGPRRFCAENPDAALVPAYATGHATAYAWHCQGRKAVIARQVLTLDDRGYPTAFWRPVSP